MTKAIYEFYWDCGRSGNVESIFIANIEDVDKAIGKKVYFGEILGKHSEIYGELSYEDLTIKTKDQDFISKFEEIMGEDFSSGYNPMDYLSENEGD